MEKMEKMETRTLIVVLGVSYVTLGAFFAFVVIGVDDDNEIAPSNFSIAVSVTLAEMLALILYALVFLCLSVRKKDQ